MINPILIYNNVLANKKEIFKNNKKKQGVYRWVNILNNKIYIGSSENLTQRFYGYLNKNTLENWCKKSRSHTISWALLKYGYENFRLEILEYCDASIVLQKEQYYLDLFKDKQKYNIAKIAGSNKKFKYSKETI